MFYFQPDNIYYATCLNIWSYICRMLSPNIKDVLTQHALVHTEKRRFIINDKGQDELKNKLIT